MSNFTSDNQSVLLIVEDHDDYWCLLQRLLGRALTDAVLRRASTNQEALQFIGNRQVRGLSMPRLIIQNLYRPDAAAGLDLLRALTQLLATSPVSGTTPVVVFSNSIQSVDIMAAYENGASLYLTKPGTFEEWQSVLGSIKTIWSQRRPVSPSSWYPHSLD